MLILEITNSPDQDSIGKIESFRSQLIIGRSLKADIIIRDQNVADFHLNLFFSKRGLHIKNAEPNLFYICNKKKINGERICEIGDLFKIGDTEIKLINFSTPSYIAENKMMSDLYLKASEDDIPLYNMLTVIEEEIEKIKADNHVKK